MSREQDFPKPEAMEDKSLPFTPEFYVKRQEEGLIAEKIVKGQQKGEIIESVVEFDGDGAPGIGKTWFLRGLETQYALQKNPGLPKPSITAFVDLRTVNQEPLIFQELAYRINLQLPEDKKISDLSGLSGDKAVQVLVNQFDTLSEKHLLVLLFDNLTCIDEETGGWFEARVVQPLVRTNKVLFVFSGDSWRRWKTSEVRHKVKSVKLSAFDEKQTREQLEKLYRVISDQEMEAVFYFTGGLPFANREIIRLLRKNAGQVDKIFAESVYKNVIEQKFLAGIPEALKPILKLTATLRKFDPNSLKHFSVALLGPEYYKEESRYFYIDAIRDMQETRLVRFSSADGLYILHPAVRKILDRNLQVREPDEFKKGHSEAAEFYRERLEKCPRNGINDLFELMFHQAQILGVQGGSQDKLVHVFADSLKALGRHPDTQWELPDMTLKLIEKVDKDSELLIETLDPAVAEKLKMIARRGLQKKADFLFR
ncbi:hypothetical protein ISS42_01830 [Candidatus Shapirobacteria bacterium]|nr:hypothetical protein [Candidatus Shapirobacteria bacterium]